MAFPLAAERIAKILDCPASAVAANWPLIEQCLLPFPGYSNRVAIAALATVAVETCYKFQPIHEIGSRDYFIKHYWENQHVRAMLGNRSPEDAWKYAGRGFIQTTGLTNYINEGRAIGVDLIDEPNDPTDDNDPDKACQPTVAACLLADFFVKHKVYEAANAGDYTRVRKIVNGGTNSLQAFLAICAKLEGAIHAKATAGAVAGS